MCRTSIIPDQGGGGYLEMYIGGGVPWHTKRGGGVLGAGTAQKGGS